MSGLIRGLSLAVTAALLVPVGAGSAATATAAATGARACSHGLVALTFDDGPSTTVTARLLDVLAARRVPATFFVVGQRVASSPRLARSAYRRGFVVANHTYAHENLTRLSDDGIRATLGRTASALRRAGVRPSGLMRPPYGAMDPRVRSVVARMGLTPVLWDVDPRDWDSGTSADIASRVLRALRPGGSNIVLLHDGVQRSGITLGAVPAIIRGAQARGYCFAALGASGRPVPPVPRARVSNAAVTEADLGDSRWLRFTVQLDRPTSRAVSVRVRSASGTATERDFTPVDRRLTFARGTLSRQVRVRVRGDRTDELREQLRLRLSAPRGLTIGDATGTGTIRDDDPPPRVRLLGATVAEPASGSVLVPFHLSLDRQSSRPVVVRVATSALSADETDYVPVDVTVEVLAGRRGADILVEVLSDAVDELDEQFELRVVEVRHGGVAKGTARVTITPPAG